MTAKQSAPNNIVLYNYDFSPFGKRVTAYLALRGIDYALCDQPFTMPRPDLALLPLAYRRNPILAVGRDIYLDTRLILRKLETLFPNNTLGASTPQDVFVEKLLEKYTIEGPVFGVIAGLVPPEVAQEPTFNKDRQGFLFKTWSKEELDEARPNCLAYVRNMFALFEGTVLRDGREWVLGGEKPSLADIEAVWAIEFASDMQLPPEFFSEKQFPKVLAWLARYRAAREEAKASAPKPTTLDGQAAANSILGSDFAELKVSVDENDPSDLKEGAEVELYPSDWITEHRDRGRLVGLAPDEVTIAVKSKGNVEFRVHAPRTGFKIREIGRKGVVGKDTRL